MAIDREISRRMAIDRGTAIDRGISRQMAIDRGMATRGSTTRRTVEALHTRTNELPTALEEQQAIPHWQIGNRTRDNRSAIQTVQILAVRGRALPTAQIPAVRDRALQIARTVTVEEQAVEAAIASAIAQYLIATLVRTVHSVAAPEGLMEVKRGATAPADREVCSHHAAAAEAEAVAEAGAVGVGDREPMLTRGAHMILRGQSYYLSSLNRAGASFLLLLLVGHSEAQGTKSAVAPAPAKQQMFASADQAADALIKAAEIFDVVQLEDILGPDSHDLIVTSDPMLDKQHAERFVAKAHEAKTVTIDPKRPTVATLSVGSDNWPMPIPIVKKNEQWHFDSRKGKLEVLYRRIGENELDVIDLCEGFVEAQKEYALEQHDGSGVNQYAQRLISTPGKHDGLAWKNEDGTWGGSVSEDIAEKIQAGYSANSEPFHGYYFKILKKQGPAAPLGAMNFVVDDIMIGGFALVAVPAQYRVTGVNSFMVGSDGIVYQKVLGPDSPKIIQTIDTYNPDKTWTPVR
jgi:hypothetical protein